MRSSYEKITEKLGDGDSVKVMSFWDRARQAVKRVMVRIRNKYVLDVFVFMALVALMATLRVRQAYVESTGRSEEKVVYITIIDAEKRKHQVTKADIIRSRCGHFLHLASLRADSLTTSLTMNLSPSMAKQLSVSPKRKVFEFKASTAVVQWLVRIISNAVPLDSKIYEDPAFTVDLIRATKKYGIVGPEGWLDDMLARSVRIDPWTCLARAWKGSDFTFEMVESVITLLPSYDVLSFATTVHAQVKDLTPADRLCTFPFGRYITVFTKRGPLTVDFPPFFAFALAINRAIELMPGFNAHASMGSEYGLRMLLLSVVLQYGTAWHDTEDLGKGSDWIAEYMK